MWYRKSKRKKRTERKKKITNEDIQMQPIISKQEEETALTKKG